MLGLSVVGFSGEVEGIKGAVGARGAIPHGDFFVQRVWDGNGTRDAATDGARVCLRVSMTRG